MQLTNEIARLSALHERGDLSGEEFERAKERVLAESAPPASFGAASHAPDGALLLYNLMATALRRAAVVLTAIALLFGCVAIWSGSRYADLRAQAESIEEEALVERFGISIPDPRPTIERAQLEVRATAFGGLAAVTGLFAVGALATALLVRPPKAAHHRAPS
ncbi:MAG: hypothetical protein ACRDZO_24750 [Egibacteraceae bacterium]